jgi:fructose 1,6-bisphosphate aldolase/phosphatase
VGLYAGPPRSVALVFQLANDKISIDQEDKPLIAGLFDDPGFSMAIHEAINKVTMLIRMGGFEPARLSAEDMECTTIQHVLQQLEKCLMPLDQS